MNVSLTKDLRNFVRQKVESGEFPSEEAVLQEAVRRFRHHDQNGGRAGDTEKAVPRTSSITSSSPLSPERRTTPSPWKRSCKRLPRSQDSMARVVIEGRRTNASKWPATSLTPAP